ncbi:MAG: hypothetical protein ACK5X3_19190 [Pseudomonadota bacterium]
MSRLVNESGAFVPVRERRSATGTLGALNAEVVLPLNGDSMALVTVVSNSFVGTLEFTAAGDSAGTNSVPVPAFPYSLGCVGGTIPGSAQPIITDALVAANTLRTYAIPCGQMRNLRVRASAYTSGNGVVTITSDTAETINLAVWLRPTTLLVSATGAAGAAVTATLPAVAGFRHVVDFIRVTRSATALLTAGATPVVVTTTNLPGPPALTFGADAAPQGVDKEGVLDFGASGLAATAVNTATTVVGPATPNVIWRVNVGYRLSV